jgi:branched-chain amino acid transport system permease protein
MPRFFGIGAFTVTLLLSARERFALARHPRGRFARGTRGRSHRAADTAAARHPFRARDARLPIVLRYVLDWLRYQEVMLPRKAQDAAWYMQYDDVRVYAMLAIALLFVSLCICHLIENSRFGLALRAIKENEQAAAAAGIDIWRRKMVATAISGAMAGIAGGLYVVVIRVAVPADVFGLHISAQAMVVTLFGGVGTLWGP